jgi:threonine/homoserine/homoserine lactone efflux protein
MTPLAALVAFTIAAALLTITPGLDTALVLRTAIAESRRSAAAAAVGICTGVLVWAAVVAVGLGALFAASEFAYTILRFAGAAYLLWLGIGLVLRPRKGGAVVADAGNASHPTARSDDRRDIGRWFVKGCLTNLLNPKVGVFYVSFLPQFVADGVAPGPFMVLLGGIHAGLGLLWFALLIAATGAIAHWLARPAIVTLLDRTTGLAFIGFGAKIALEERALR